MDDESSTTSELHQAHLPTSKVVKAFNNISFVALGSLARPSGSDDRSALPIAGDDGDAKAAVSEFLDKIGYDVVDAGPLSEGWRFQRDTAAYVTPYGTADDVTTPQSAPAEKITTALAQAKRYRDLA